MPFLGLLLFAVVAAIAGIAPLFRPVSTAHKTIRVVVPEGSNAHEVGALLEQKGVIRSAWAFGWYLRWKGEGKGLKAGHYALSSDMTLGQLAQELGMGGGRGGAIRVRVTVPEGYTLRQVGELLGEKGVTDTEEFLKLATSEETIGQLHADFPLPTRSLEGYLFPDTYFFPPQTPALQVIDAMVLNFSNRFARPYRSEIGRDGRDLHTLVTEASLIEREAKAPEDRPRIAGVLDNRLKRGMRLEVDATVLYALGHHKDRVLYKDLKVDSPYNTYRHKGLPPGPIANPGMASLLAALRPEQNDFLYYVAKPDGAHIFSRTAGEHNVARRQARLERQRRPMETQPGG